MTDRALSATRIALAGALLGVVRLTGPWPPHGFWAWFNVLGAIAFTTAIVPPARSGTPPASALSLRDRRAARGQMVVAVLGSAVVAIWLVRDHVHPTWLGVTAVLGIIALWTSGDWPRTELFVAPDCLLVGERDLDRATRWSPEDIVRLERKSPWWRDAEHVAVVDREGDRTVLLACPVGTANAAVVVQWAREHGVAIADNLS